MKPSLFEKYNIKIILELCYFKIEKKFKLMHQLMVSFTYLPAAPPSAES